MEKKEYYITDGGIRGSCDHRHLSLRTAEKCLKEDQEGCSMQGGYSDRSIYWIDKNGDSHEVMEEEG